MNSKEQTVQTTSESGNAAKLPVGSWAVTGTFHGMLIEAETEGEARRIFHKYYNGESITHIRKRDIPALCF